MGFSSLTVRESVPPAGPPLAAQAGAAQTRGLWADTTMLGKSARSPGEDDRVTRAHGDRERRGVEPGHRQTSALVREVRRSTKAA
jgi:hypothetical protein